MKISNLQYTGYGYYLAVICTDLLDILWVFSLCHPILCSQIAARDCFLLDGNLSNLYSSRLFDKNRKSWWLIIVSDLLVVHIRRGYQHNIIIMAAGDPSTAI